MYPLKKMSAAFAAILPLSLAGCGGTGQDESQVSGTVTHTISGRAIDGHIARASVFHDSNNNGRRDAWEAYAFTDDEGYFSFNPKTDTDYCAASADEEMAQYCLQVTASHTTAVIRVDDGYDRLTSEPFVGQLSRRLALGDTAENTIISPLTSLVSHLDESAGRQAVLDKLDLDEADLDQDYLDRGGLNEVDARLLNLALKLHKTTTVIAENLTQTYGAIGTEVNTPNDATSSVYRHLSHAIATSRSDGGSALADPTLLRSVTDKAEADIQQVYAQRDFAPPPSGPLAASDKASLTQRAALVSAVTDRLFDPATVVLSQAQAKGLASALEIVVLKASRDDTSDQDVQRVAEFLLTDQSADLVAALVDALSDEQGDLSQLVNQDFSRLTSLESIAAAARIPGDATPFSDLSGKSLLISDLDLGHAPHALDDSEVELYFLGDSNATRGPLSACVKHIEDASSDGTLGEASTRGELVSGYWSLMGTTGESESAYNVLLTINFLGARYQAILKSAGREVLGGVNQHRVRFDHQGEITQWYSIKGVQSVDHLPRSNADCRERLPSRIGI